MTTSRGDYPRRVFSAAIMPGRAVSVFALATFSGMISTALSSTSSASSSSPPCVPLFGIESGGNTADGLLDSDAYNGTFAFRAVSAFASPCSEGLETPISMRNLLGKFLFSVVFPGLLYFVSNSLRQQDVPHPASIVQVATCSRSAASQTSCLPRSKGYSESPLAYDITCTEHGS